MRLLLNRASIMTESGRRHRRLRRRQVRRSRLARFKTHSISTTLLSNEVVCVYVESLILDGCRALSDADLFPTWIIEMKSSSLRVSST
jgi:hypothetical protein